MTIPDGLSDIECKIYTTVLQIRSHKRSRIHPSTRGDFKSRIVPDYTLYVGELLPLFRDYDRRDIAAALNRLYKAGHIATHQCMNDTAIEINEK